MSIDQNMRSGDAYDLFIATPMSALGEAKYAAGRAGIISLMEQLTSAHDFGRMYFAGETITEAEAFTGEADALRRDLQALRSSRLFVLVYPYKIVTSALVEAGYALALRLPSLLLVRERNDLPFLLHSAQRMRGDQLLPTIWIETFGELPEVARKIAEFRDRVAVGEHTDGKGQG
jgi:hypothetical protein